MVMFLGESSSDYGDPYGYTGSPMMPGMRGMGYPGMPGTYPPMGRPRLVAQEVQIDEAVFTVVNPEATYPVPDVADREGPVGDAVSIPQEFLLGPMQQAFLGTIAQGKEPDRLIRNNVELTPSLVQAAQEFREAHDVAVDTLSSTEARQRHVAAATEFAGRLREQLPYIREQIDEAKVTEAIQDRGHEAGARFMQQDRPTRLAEMGADDPDRRPEEDEIVARYTKWFFDQHGGELPPMVHRSDRTSIEALRGVIQRMETAIATHPARLGVQPRWGFGETIDVGTTEKLEGDRAKLSQLVGEAAEQLETLVLQPLLYKLVRRAREIENTTPTTQLPTVTPRVPSGPSAPPPASGPAVRPPVSAPPAASNPLPPTVWPTNPSAPAAAESVPAATAPATPEAAPATDLEYDQAVWEAVGDGAFSGDVIASVTARFGGGDNVRQEVNASVRRLLDVHIQQGRLEEGRGYWISRDDDMLPPNATESGPAKIT